MNAISSAGSPPTSKNSTPFSSTKSLKAGCVASLTRCPPCSASTFATATNGCTSPRLPITITTIFNLGGACTSSSSSTITRPSAGNDLSVPLRNMLSGPSFSFLKSMWMRPSWSTKARVLNSSWVMSKWENREGPDGRSFGRCPWRCRKCLCGGMPLLGSGSREVIAGVCSGEVNIV